MKWIIIAELFSYVYRHKLVSTARKRKGLKKEGLVYVHLTNVLSSSHCYTFQHRYRSTVFLLGFCFCRLICWSYSRLGWIWVPPTKFYKLCWRPPQYAPAPYKLTISSYLFAMWHLFRHVGYLRHEQQVGLWPFDLESGVRVTCDHVTSVPILVFLGLSVLDLSPMYATDVRQTDVRQHHRLMHPPYGGGGIIILITV